MATKIIGKKVDKIATYATRDPKIAPFWFVTKMTEKQGNMVYDCATECSTITVQKFFLIWISRQTKNLHSPKNH